MCVIVLRRFSYIFRTYCHLPILKELFSDFRPLPVSERRMCSFVCLSLCLFGCLFLYRVICLSLFYGKFVLVLLFKE